MRGARIWTIETWPRQRLDSKGAERFARVRSRQAYLAAFLVVGGGCAKMGGGASHGYQDEGHADNVMADDRGAEALTTAGHLLAPRGAIDPNLGPYPSTVCAMLFSSAAFAGQSLLLAAGARVDDLGSWAGKVRSAVAYSGCALTNFQGDAFSGALGSAFGPPRSGPAHLPSNLFSTLTTGVRASSLVCDCQPGSHGNLGAIVFVDDDLQGNEHAYLKGQSASLASEGVAKKISSAWVAPGAVLVLSAPSLVDGTPVRLQGRVGHVLNNDEAAVIAVEAVGGDVDPNAGPDYDYDSDDNGNIENDISCEPANGCFSNRVCAYAPDEPFALTDTADACRNARTAPGDAGAPGRSWCRPPRISDRYPKCMEDLQ